MALQPALDRRYWVMSAPPELGLRLESNWLRTDEQRDVLHSLRHANDCAIAAEKRPEMWKWSIIAMHNAVQGAMVCHLSGSMQLGALTIDSGQKWLAYLQHERDPNMAEPKTVVAPIGELFERVTTGEQKSKNKTGSWVNDARQAPIPVPEPTKVAFDKLVSLRNDLIHFSPRGWSIEVSGLPHIHTQLANFIAQIVAASGAFRHLDGSERQELSSLLKALSVHSA